MATPILRNHHLKPPYFGIAARCLAGIPAPSGQWNHRRRDLGAAEGQSGDAQGRAMGRPGAMARVKLHGTVVQGLWSRSALYQLRIDGMGLRSGSSKARSGRVAVQLEAGGLIGTPLSTQKVFGWQVGQQVSAMLRQHGRRASPCAHWQGWRVAFIGIGTLSVLVGIFAAGSSGCEWSQCLFFLCSHLCFEFREYQGLHHDRATQRDIWGACQGLTEETA